MDYGFLEYGAFGLLAVVLVGVGIWLRSYMNREQETRERREEKDRGERNELTGKVVALVEASAAKDQALTATLDNLCEQVKACKEDQGAVAKVLEKLVDGQKRHEERANERHRQQMEQGRQMIEALRAMNGKT